eukprot:12126085-Alexandrium_andersonii.AAC.1
MHVVLRHALSCRACACSGHSCVQAWHAHAIVAIAPVDGVRTPSVSSSRPQPVFGCSSGP